MKTPEQSASVKHNIHAERGDKLTPNLTTHSLISPGTALALALWLSISSHLLNELLHFSIIPIS